MAYRAMVKAAAAKNNPWGYFRPEIEK